MYTSFRAATVAAVFWLGAAAAATAAETSIQMQAIRDKGPGPAIGPVIGPVIGTVHAVETAEGLVLQLDLADLPPGPNRLFLYDAGDCSVPRGELLSSAPLAVVNVDITEDGAEPLKQAVMVSGASLAELSHQALVIHRGGQTADLGPEQTGLRRLVACGVAQ
jgi:Cu/Zn superoxide dismutase